LQFPQQSIARYQRPKEAAGFSHPSTRLASCPDPPDLSQP
jgi:hypothetical protein